MSTTDQHARNLRRALIVRRAAALADKRERRIEQEAKAIEQLDGIVDAEAK